MKMRIIVVAAALACAALSGCKDLAPEAPGAAAAVPEPDKAFRENPDFGGVKTVTIEAEGVGPTPSVAALRALDQAIAQVNGRRVTSKIGAASAGMTVNVQGLGSSQMVGDAFLEEVVSGSDGVVKSFRVISQEEVERVDVEYSFNGEAQVGGWFGDSIKVSESEKHLSRYWKVRVTADVAKFVGPEDDGRPKLVVAAARTSDASYPVGDAQVESAAVAAEIRARLSDALTQTERFQVLDREMTSEMQDEVDFINSGNARSEEVARLGQRLATDLILVPTIERFAYPRSSRTLRLSGRELTSYSGGGRVSLKLVNATTGEVVLSESFEHALPKTGPSTLPRSIDGAGMAGTMMDSLSDRMIRSVVNEIFPVSVIALTGDQVVLSQGGKSVSKGDRYEAVILGEELKDPQTGRSLGRNEVPCCTIRVDRVADQTSYGTIEGDLPTALSGFKPGMVELREFAAAPTTTAPEVVNSTTVAQSAARTTARATKRAPAKTQAPADDENW